MLWTLLTAIGSSTVVATAVLAGRDADAGSVGYAMAVAVGLLLGACNAIVMARLARAAADRPLPISPSSRERKLRVLYVAAVLWLPVAAIVGTWLASSAIRLVG